MKDISDLKPGDKVRDVNFRTTEWYEYLCVHPNHKSYRTLLKGGSDPIKMHEDKLKFILDQGLETEEDAARLLINKMKGDILDIENIFGIKVNKA